MPEIARCGSKFESPQNHHFETRMDPRPPSGPTLPAGFPYPYVYQQTVPVGQESFSCVMTTNPPTSGASKAYYYPAPYSQQQQQPAYPQCPVMMFYVPHDGAISPPAAPPAHPPTERAPHKILTAREPNLRPPPRALGPPTAVPHLPPVQQKTDRKKVVFPGPTKLAASCREMPGFRASLERDFLTRLE
jgi:hypothetical protein